MAKIEYKKGDVLIFKDDNLIYTEYNNHLKNFKNGYKYTISSVQSFSYGVDDDFPPLDVFFFENLNYGCYKHIIEAHFIKLDVHRNNIINSIL
jgi:hypothetical protein